MTSTVPATDVKCWLCGKLKGQPPERCPGHYQTVPEEEPRSDTRDLARFPILISPQDRLDYPSWPRTIPWKLIAPHAKQAYENHGQTLERLAERGGLGVVEAWAVLLDLPLVKVIGADPDECARLLKTILEGGIGA